MSKLQETKIKSSLYRFSSLPSQPHYLLAASFLTTEGCKSLLPAAKSD